MLTATSAIEIADYLLWLAAHECESDPDYLTPLKLQKLLYFVQGWCLVESGRPAFKEGLEAWRDGPVVPAVFERFKLRANAPIQDPSPTAPASLSDAERSHVRSVWNAYKQYSGWALRDLTHAEGPWKDHYKPDAHGRSNSTIPLEDVRRAFMDRLRARLERTPEYRASVIERAKANTRAAYGRDVA